jgi:hypothetical protein
MDDDAYVWRFKLAEPPAAAGEDALLDMMSEQLRALLRCVTLLDDGEPLRVTGFRLLSERDGEHPVSLDV